jgi:hypothetical protein
MEFKVSLQSYRPKSSVGTVAPIFLMQPMRITIDAGTVRVTPATQPAQILLKWKCTQSKCAQVGVGLVKFVVSTPIMEDHTYEFACLSSESVQQAFEAGKSGQPAQDKKALSPPTKQEPTKPQKTKTVQIDSSKPQFHKHGLTLVKCPATALHTNLIYAIVVAQDTVKFVGYSSKVDEHAFNKPRYTMKAPTLGAAAAEKNNRDEVTGGIVNESAPEPASSPEPAPENHFEVVHDPQQQLAVAKTGKTVRKKGSLKAPSPGKGAEKGKDSKRVSAAPLATAHSIFEGSLARAPGSPAPLNMPDTKGMCPLAKEQLPVIQLDDRPSGRTSPDGVPLGHTPRSKSPFQNGARQGHEAEKVFPRDKTAFKALDYYHVQPDGTHPDVIVFDIKGGGSYSFECPDRRPYVEFFNQSSAAALKPMLL